MRAKSGIILSAEEYFAGRVALGVRVRTPVKTWLQFIPGMFIYDAYIRSREKRIYSQYFMMPRELSMKCARRLAEGADRGEIMAAAEDEIGKWLKSRGMHSDNVFEKNMALVRLLVDHYGKLLQAEGRSHRDLVIYAYRDRHSYEAYVRELARLENQVDEALVEKFGGAEGLRKDLQAQQNVKEEFREKDIDGIF